ncbi:MAG TPA: tRNA epoxyqueuosine(34) reductase QueG [Burkholderiaceae bacterium]|nr:tRNA epoxyqueuosine(34) reductase QueG [Burkholderiaceae bacterium]
MAANEVARPRKDNDADTLNQLAASIKAWGRDLGFGAIAIASLDMSEPSRRLKEWLAAGRHGEMEYMERHAHLRADPSTLLPGAIRSICARLDYRPREDDADWIGREVARLDDRAAAVVSIYARGRDYHKVLRDRLQKLATRIEQEGGEFRYRVCTDSAPVLEIELARRGGLGWRGKHTLLLTREAGSMFFLGEILTDLPLPVDAPVDDHCGTCQRCIDVCPTRAITAPYQLDARRCISYLTIEHKSAIPEALRAAIGNRIYGCDDCQLACPWNKYAQVASFADFDVRNGLDRATLIELFAWTEEEFRSRHAGSAILRIGYERWLRNIAVGLGNAETSTEVIEALRARTDHPSSLVREHVAWALAQHGA